MPIDFGLSAEQKQLQSSARSLARDALIRVQAEALKKTTAEERFLASRPFYRALVEAGFLARFVPRSAGGEKRELIDSAIELEELVAVDRSVPMSAYATALALMPLVLFGTDDQRRRFLAPFIVREGDPLASLAFSETGGSANFQNPDPEAGLRTVAHRDGDEWVISGAKQFIPNASGWHGEGAALVAVVCRTDLSLPPQDSLTVILVQGGTQGVTYTSMSTIGHRASLLSRIEFDQVRVPAANAIGQPGDGIKILGAALSSVAALVGSFAVGVMRAAFDAALAFTTTERRGASHPIVDFQNVGSILVDAKVRLEASRYLTWKACDYLDRTAGAGTELAIAAKIFASETAVHVVNDLMRAVGAESYTTDQPFGDLLQDAVAYPLFLGGNVGVRRVQLQRLMSAPDYDPLAASEGRRQTLG